MEFSYTKVEDYIDELENIRIDIEKNLSDIKSIINTINSSWSGIAKDNYINKFNKISLNFDDFSNEIKACTAYMTRSSDRYKELDEKNKEEIQDIIESSNIFV